MELNIIGKCGNFESVFRNFYQSNVIFHFGLLIRFVGMVTDSRSFLSFLRHEYFRRILCNVLGDEIEKGELPNDIKLIGNMVEAICYKNAKPYFTI